jgi:hypothetical protein
MISAVRSACALAAASTTAGQSSGVAPPRDRPVCLSGGGDHLLDLGDAGGAQVDAGGDPLVQRQVGAEQPGEHGCGDAGAAQRQRFAERARAQPGRPTVERGAGRGHHAVPVPVALDDRHDGRVGAGAHQRHVAADRVEIDPHFGLPHATSVLSGRPREPVSRSRRLGRRGPRGRLGRRGPRGRLGRRGPRGRLGRRRLISL